MPEDASAADNEIIFGKFAAHVARNRAVVQSWMVGAKEGPSRFADNNAGKVEDDDAEVFDFKPELELAGLGSNTSKLSESERARLDPELRSQDASVAFLHQHLLGKKSKAPKIADISRSGHGLHGIDPTFTPSRNKSGPASRAEEGTEDAPPATLKSRAPRGRDETSDEDDDVGRSGLGGTTLKQPASKKRKLDIRSGGKVGNHKKLHADTRTAGSGNEDEDDQQTNEEVADQVEIEAAVEQAVPPTITADSRVKAKKKATSFLDELLAKKAAKQKKKSRQES